MTDVVTIKQAVQRAKEDGIPVSEYSLRIWVRQGVIPSRRAGTKALIYYPALVRYLRCEEESR